MAVVRDAALPMIVEGARLRLRVSHWPTKWVDMRVNQYVLLTGNHILAAGFPGAIPVILCDVSRKLSADSDLCVISGRGECLVVWCCTDWESCHGNMFFG